MHHRTTTLLLLLLLFCMSSFLVASSGPADVPLHDILGRNLTMDNAYYIRNYNVSAWPGTGGGLALYRGRCRRYTIGDGLALYSGRGRGRHRCRCAKYVGFSSNAADTGLAVQLVPYKNGSTVIYAGERFKLVLDSRAPCRRSRELGIECGRFGTYVVTGGFHAIQSYFRVDVDKLGRYSLLYCGSCASCNQCYTLGLSDRSKGTLFWSNGDVFNLFFQKKVDKLEEGSELHQSQ